MQDTAICIWSSNGTMLLFFGVAATSLTTLVVMLSSHPKDSEEMQRTNSSEHEFQCALYGKKSDKAMYDRKRITKLGKSFQFEAY